MFTIRPAPTTRPRHRPTILAALITVVATTALSGCRSPASSSSSAAPPIGAYTGHASRQPIPKKRPVALPTGVPGELPGQLQRDPHGALDLAEGQVPDGVTVFDDQYPAVANLQPDLLDALRRAATAAATDGVQFNVDSGWRSRTYQAQLFRQAVAKYGSPQQAAQWVAPPGTSAHEAGAAVDIGDTGATNWLSEHGAHYGLCQIYRNEPWHYELRPGAVDSGCPTMYADPTHDPRVHS